MALICHISEARQDIQDMPESQTHVQYVFPLEIRRPKTKQKVQLLIELRIIYMMSYVSLSTST